MVEPRLRTPRSPLKLEAVVDETPVRLVAVVLTLVGPLTRGESSALVTDDRGVTGVAVGLLPRSVNEPEAAGVRDVVTVPRGLLWTMALVVLPTALADAAAEPERAGCVAVLIIVDGRALESGCFLATAAGYRGEASVLLRDAVVLEGAPAVLGRTVRRWVAVVAAGCFMLVSDRLGLDAVVLALPGVTAVLALPGVTGAGSRGLFGVSMLMVGAAWCRSS